ncbi:hypothetical protein ACEI25_002265 [Photobacterium damselae]
MSDTVVSSIIVPALVSLVATVVTLFLKSIAESKTHERKLSMDHKLSEKKKIKESISKHKTPVLNAFEELNHRLWNLGKTHQEEWHKLNGVYLQDDKYYFHSFVYRLSAVICWADKVDRDMVFLDTTISDKEDLDFLKFCKFVNIFLCQTSTYKGLDYNESQPVDHFYRHLLVKEANNLLNGEGRVISYSVFESDLSSKVKSMKGICQFIDSVSPTEERYRWGKLYCLQLLIVCFMNSYGYDFQKTTDNQIKEIIAVLKLHRHGDSMLQEFKEALKKQKLDTNDEISKLINVITS